MMIKRSMSDPEVQYIPFNLLKFFGGQHDSYQFLKKERIVKSIDTMHINYICIAFAATGTALFA